MALFMLLAVLPNMAIGVPLIINNSFVCFNTHMRESNYSENSLLLDLSKPEPHRHLLDCISHPGELVNMFV